MIKFYLNKSFIKKTDLKWFTEIFLLVPFLKKDIYFQFLLPYLGYHNESLYTKLLYTGRNLIRETTEINNCTVSILPFKYYPNDKRVEEISKYANTYNKKVIAFYNDDSSDIYSLPKNLFLFRTSIIKSKQQENERAFPCLIPDHFCGTYDCNNSISFCGAITSQQRLNTIKGIEQLKLPTDFVIRNNFWGHSTDIKHRLEYNTNLLNSKYALCVRGAGNFSYRFYEALSFGRIPILINTDCLLPYETSINWDEYIIKVNENELQKLPELLKADKRCMQNNRKFWEEYLSVEGYSKNFLKEFDNI
jgi:hypothetical protein